MVVRGYPGDIPGFFINIWKQMLRTCCWQTLHTAVSLLSSLDLLIAYASRTELGHPRRTKMLQYSRVGPSSYGKICVRGLGVGSYRSGIGREGISVILGIYIYSTSL